MQNLVMIRQAWQKKVQAGLHVDFWNFSAATANCVMPEGEVKIFLTFQG